MQEAVNEAVSFFASSSFAAHRRRHVPLELCFMGASVSVNSSEFASDQLDVGDDAVEAALRSRLEGYASSWPRILAALDNAQRLSLKVGEFHYPLSVLRMSPELLRGESAQIVVVAAETEMDAIHLFQQCVDASHGKPPLLDRAMSCIKQCVSLEPENAVFLCQQSEILRLMKRFQDGTDLLKRLHLMRPDYALVLVRLAAIQVDTKQYYAVLLTLHIASSQQIFRSACAEQLVRFVQLSKSRLHLNTDWLSRVPFQVMCAILDSVNMYDMLRLSQVSTGWRLIGMSDRHWRHKYGFPRAQVYEEYLSSRRQLRFFSFHDGWNVDGALFHIGSPPDYDHCVWRDLLAFLSCQGFHNAAVEYPALVERSRYSYRVLSSLQSLAHAVRSKSTGCQYAMVPANQLWCKGCLKPYKPEDNAVCPVKGHTGFSGPLNVVIDKLPPGDMKRQLQKEWKGKFNGMQYTKRGRGLPSVWSCCGSSEAGCVDSPHRPLVTQHYKLYIDAIQTTTELKRVHLYVPEGSSEAFAICQEDNRRALEKCRSRV